MKFDYAGEDDNEDDNFRPDETIFTSRDEDPNWEDNYGSYYDEETLKTK
jgi:hypothetical protein